MEKIFVDGHGWCEVWSLPKVSPKKQREGKYIGESFVHPAKMDVVLCRKIIETYTEPGELVKITPKILKELKTKGEWCKCE